MFAVEFAREEIGELHQSWITKEDIMYIALKWAQFKEVVFQRINWEFDDEFAGIVLIAFENLEGIFVL